MRSLNIIGIVLIVVVILVVVALFVVNSIYFSDEKYDASNFKNSPREQEVNNNFEVETFDVNKAFGFAKESPVCLESNLNVNNYEYDDQVKAWRFDLGEERVSEYEGTCNKYCVFEEITKMTRVEERCSGWKNNTYEPEVKALTLVAGSIERTYPTNTPSVYGYVKDPNGFGVPDIEIAVGGPENSTKTKEDGYFEIGSVNPGEWKLIIFLSPAQDRRYLKTESTKIEMSASEPTRQDVTLGFR